MKYTYLETRLGRILLAADDEGVRLISFQTEKKADHPQPDWIEDPEALEGYIPIQTKRSPGKLFALRVQGESMTGTGILPGDVVIVRRQPTANSGEIVVALVGDEATVKRLRFRRRRVELHPENPDFDVIVPDPEDLTLLGKVIEVRRYLGRP